MVLFHEMAGNFVPRGSRAEWRELLRILPRRHATAKQNVVSNHISVIHDRRTTCTCARKTTLSGQPCGPDSCQRVRERRSSQMAAVVAAAIPATNATR